MTLTLLWSTYTGLKKPTMGPNGELVGLGTEPQKVVGGCEVTAILILYGLPRYNNLF